jgi:hypothetical protein
MAVCTTRRDAPKDFILAVAKGLCVHIRAKDMLKGIQIPHGRSSLA